MKNKKLRNTTLFALFLILLSAALYSVHFLYFHDLHHILIYLVGDIAFVPIEVLMVTLIIHQVLVYREKKAMLNKMNMVIGAFFSEVGTQSLRFFADFDKDTDQLAKHLDIDNNWNHAHFTKVRNVITKRTFKLEVDRQELDQLRQFMVQKRPFLLRLLENPNLLEHDRFTELLWAIFHLAEELSARDSIAASSDRDIKHLQGDILRAYKKLIIQWLDYAKHLKNNYPYLFSLTVRTNPFNQKAKAQIA
jgi:hypothetical protein